MSLSETEYSQLAARELQLLLQALDALGESVEAELESDILSIEFPDGARFVINSHRAARQIWMAAGTHAWHFDPRDGRWIASKNGDELWSALASELSKKLAREIRLKAC